MSLTLNGSTYEQLPNGSYVNPAGGNKMDSAANRSKGVKRDLLKITRATAGLSGDTLHEGYVQLNLTLNMSADPILDVPLNRATGSNAIEMANAVLDAFSLMTGYTLASNERTAAIAHIAVVLDRVEAGLFPVLDAFVPAAVSAS